MTFMRKILPFVLLLAICLSSLSLVSCNETANAAKYDRAEAKTAVVALRNYVREKKGVGKSLVLLQDNQVANTFIYLQKPQTEEDEAKVDEEPLYISSMIYSEDERYSFRLDLILDKHNPEMATRRFRYFDSVPGRFMLVAEDTFSIPYYIGKETMSFDKVEYPQPESQDGGDAETSVALLDEQFLKETARNLLNFSIAALDAYCEKAISHDREDFGFVCYNETYNPTNAPVPASHRTDRPTVALLSSDGLTESTSDTTEMGGADGPVETIITGEILKPAETEAAPDPLGPAFSGERWSYALRMTLLGMGMVFAVLAILWLILLIFKAIFSGKTEKKPEPTPEPVAPAPTPVPAGTDPAVVAAITAAIAEMIASDEELSSEFAGGFRVVEFRRKSGKTSWNR